jgi:hypothetical protein
MACPQLENEGHSLQICGIAMNISNKQLPKTDKGWPSNLEVRHGTNITSA